MKVETKIIMTSSNYHTNKEIAEHIIVNLTRTFDKKPGIKKRIVIVKIEVDDYGKGGK